MELLPYSLIAYEYLLYAFLIAPFIILLPCERLFQLRCPHDKTGLTYIYATDEYDIYTCRYGHEIRKKKSIRTFIRNLPFYLMELRSGLRLGGGGRGGSGGGFGGGGSGGGGAGR